MNPDLLEKRLEIWKRILLIDIGAVFTLLATGIAEIPNRAQPYFPGWYAVWFMVFLASLIPGFVLSLGKHWMKLPLEKRLNTIFSFLSLTWITFLPMGILNRPFGFFYFLIALGALISIIYFLLRQNNKKKQNEIFP